MKILDKTPSRTSSLLLRAAAPVAASLALLAVSAAAFADEPAPAEITAEPPARSILVIHDHDDGGQGPTRMRNRGLLAGGIVMAAVGIASTIAGAALLSSSTPQPPACSSGPGATIPAAGALCTLGTALQYLPGKQFEGFTLAVGGGGLIAGGLAMAIVGGWQIPISSPTRAQQAAGVPAVAVGAQKATLTWTF